MANSKLLIGLEENLITCPVCLDIYKEPRRLECEHSLCKFCVDHLLKNRAITCPICRKKTDEAHLKNNLLLVALLDSYNNLQTPKASTSHSCQINLRKRDFEGNIKGHDTQPEKCEHCDLCEKLKAHHFCHNCKKILCDVCVRAHIKLSGCSENESGSLQGASTRQMKILEQELALLAEKALEFDNKFKTAKNEYTQRKNEGLITLEKAKDEFVKMAAQHFSKQEENFEGYARQLQAQAEQMHVELMKNVKECQNAFNGLQFFKPCEIVKKSADIRTELKKSLDTLQVAKFTDMKINDDKCLALKSKEALEHLMILPSTSEKQSGLQNLILKKFHLEKKVDLPAACFKLLLVKDQLWCFHLEFITVHCPLTGEYIETKEIDTNQTFSATYVGNSQRILIAARDEDLQLLDTNNDEMTEVKTGTFHSVCAYKGKYLALREEDSIVFIDTFEEQNGGLIQTKSVQTDLRVIDIFTLTMEVSNDNIFVCGLNAGLYQLDHEGRTITSWHAANSQRICPILCGADSSGWLLVADQLKHRLLVLRPENKNQPWTVVDVDADVKYPGAVLMSENGKLYIASFHPKTLCILS